MTAELIWIVYPLVTFKRFGLQEETDEDVSEFDVNSAPAWSEQSPEFLRRSAFVFWSGRQQVTGGDGVNVSQVDSDLSDCDGHSLMLLLKRVWLD